MQHGRVAADEVKGNDDEVPVMYCRCGKAVPRSAMPEPGAGYVRYTCPQCGRTGNFGTSAKRG
jgi:hypothetical protein